MTYNLSYLNYSILNINKLGWLVDGKIWLFSFTDNINVSTFFRNVGVV